MTRKDIGSSLGQDELVIRNMAEGGGVRWEGSYEDLVREGLISSDASPQDFQHLHWREMGEIKVLVYPPRRGRDRWGALSEPRGGCWTWMAAERVQLQRRMAEVEFAESPAGGMQRVRAREANEDGRFQAALRLLTAKPARTSRTQTKGITS